MLQVFNVAHVMMLVDENTDSFLSYYCLWVYFKIFYSTFGYLLEYFFFHLTLVSWVLVVFCCT